MAKAFTTYKLLNGKEPLLGRMVCEVRFQDGQLYLDHCGRLLKKLMQTGEWVVLDPSPAGTSVYHLVEGYVLSFSMQAASLDLNRGTIGEEIKPDEVEGFINQTESVLGLVIDEVEAAEFDRLGFRQWYYFSCETKAEAENWLNELGLFSIPSKLSNAFQATPEALGVSLVMEGQDCHYRIALNGKERSAQVPVGDTSLSVRSSTVPTKQRKALIEALKKERQRQVNSRFMVEMDIDAYRPEPTELNLADFIRNCSAGNLEKFREATSKDNAKKGKK